MATRSSQEEQFWDNNSISSKILVINELQNGVEVTKQSRILHHFDKSLFLSSAEKLLDEIISSSERALTMLSHSFQADSENTREPVSKKRKTMEKCTKRVRVSLETCIDGYVEDRFNWRKYGQKYIQGASHPRKLSNQKGAFEKLATADSESQVEFDDGGHLSFAFSSFLSSD